MKGGLVIRPLEPLHLGLKNLGGVEEFSTDESITLPLSSTVLGALGNALGIRLNVDCSKYIMNGEYDFEDFKQLIKNIYNKDLKPGGETHSDNPYLWGPILRINNENYASVGSIAIRINKLSDYVRAAVEGLHGHEISNS